MLTIPCVVFWCVSDANEAEVTHEVDAPGVRSRSGLGWLTGRDVRTEPVSAALSAKWRHRGRG
ncbi:hypothetical protein JCM12141A_58340 [Mycolicibacterium hodleri]